MFNRLGIFVSRHWLLTILVWVVIVVVVRRTTPKWDSVMHDGDFAYMPAEMDSVQGELMLRKAFPEGRAKSEVVVILARQDRPIDADDVNVVKSVVCRFKNLLGTSCYEHAKQFSETAETLRAEGKIAEADGALKKGNDFRARSVEAFESAVQRLEDPESIERDPYFAKVAHNLAIVYAEEGSTSEAEGLRELAWDLDPTLKLKPQELTDNFGALPLNDVWSRYTDRFGDSLRSKDHMADLVFLRLPSEFMATGNIGLLGHIKTVLTEAHADLPSWPAGLEFGISGSAAVGSDMLRSAKESISNTELYTVILVITILLLVYRSPVLVAVPLISIVISLMVSTGLVAQLTTLGEYPGMEWWNFKIFTTTKIFVVVILFGAGTDYCLFLIARYKEELDAGHARSDALALSLGGVGEALTASALTTILGLGTMFFAQFGKFRNSGPAIGLCLLVTLLACLTLAPALLQGLGKYVYWTPFSRKNNGNHSGERLAGEGQLGTPQDRAPNGLLHRIWCRVADVIVAKPGLVLMSCTLLMLPFFFLGFSVDITYDLLSELDPQCDSRQGAVLLRRHFPVGESGPVVVLAHKPGGDFDSSEGIEAIRQLTDSLRISGVTDVRSLIAPTGGATKTGAMRFIRQNHRISREIYLSKDADSNLGGDVTRLELILEHDPFSLEATEVLARVDERLTDLGNEQDSYWSESRFVFAGTTAAIRDLRTVTSSDNVRIQWLVVLAVFVILLLLLRRPAVCVYLILSVLFSYYVTIGATELYFKWSYGDTFQGLDWKVPLFLFVILVAIGQDYNIYLATRVFEEQKEHGLFGGLRQAIIRTGGIITSCGVIMAGTFLSMTTGSMRGIVELGFALTLGVLLDTFVVRPILVPAFLALLFRWHVRREAATVRRTVVTSS